MPARDAQSGGVLPVIGSIFGVVVVEALEFVIDFRPVDVIPFLIWVDSEPFELRFGGNKRLKGPVRMEHGGVRRSEIHWNVRNPLYLYTF